jgi:uncharacterized glyoxalase superfamily protein PhnB
VPAATAWLCSAFGMEVHRAVAGEDGAPCYAELTFGGGMLMVAPVEDTAFGRLMVQPNEIGGVETQVCYLSVPDVQVLYIRARAAGARIVLDIEDEANDGRGFSCRDPEGHLWNFGTYDPWLQQRDGARCEDRHRRREQHGLAALLLLSLLVVLTAEAVPQPQSARAGVALAETKAREPAGVEQRRPETPEPPAREAPADRVHAHSAALKAAERVAAEARTQLADAQSARAKAERATADAHAQLDDLRQAKEAAERAAAEAGKLLTAAQEDAKEAREQAALERTKRLAEAAARTPKRVAAFRLMRPRPRVWCYNPNAPNPASNGRGRLAGFCKG